MALFQIIINLILYAIAKKNLLNSNNIKFNTPILKFLTIISKKITNHIFTHKKKLKILFKKIIKKLKLISFFIYLLQHFLTNIYININITKAGWVAIAKERAVIYIRAGGLSTLRLILFYKKTKHNVPNIYTI